MDLASFEFSFKDIHHVLVLLNARKPLEGDGCDGDLVVVFSAGEVDDLDGSVGVGLLKTLFHLYWCHRGRNVKHFHVRGKSRERFSFAS